MLARILWAIAVAASTLAGGGGEEANVADAHGAVHVHTDGGGAVTLWVESNGRPGLQAGAAVGEGWFVAPDVLVLA